MQLTHILSLLGGLALFLYGMKQLGDGLELVAGARLRTLLERLTANPLLGLLVGVTVTAAIQSSSATTVMVVGFLSAGLLRLEQAVYVIMGANIGTTITSLIIGLNITALAPVALLIGVILLMVCRKKWWQHLGTAVLGFGLLFTGMSTMSAAMAPLAAMPEFAALMTRFENPVLGVLMGAGLTAVIQSSSASVGIVQALVSSGAANLGGVIFILFGQNIGTCVTAMLASIGANRAGRRAAFVHLLFNVIGTLIFIPVCLFLPYVEFIQSLTPTPALQVSLAHIFFNVVSSLLLFPFAGGLVWLTKRIVPGEDPKMEECRLQYLNDSTLSTPPFAVTQVTREVGRMAGIVRDNLRLAMETFFKPEDAAMKQVAQNEQVVNYLNHNITDYLIRIHALDLSDEDSRLIGGMFHVVNDLERIGDHAENILEYARLVQEGVTFSAGAQDELRDMSGRVERVLDEATAFFLQRQNDPDVANHILAQEEDIDDRVIALRDEHVRRLGERTCTPRAGMLYIDILTDLERVSDHATNIVYASFEDPFPAAAKA